MGTLLPHRKKVPEKGDENIGNYSNIEYTYFYRKKVPEKGDENVQPMLNTTFSIIEKRSPRKGTKTFFEN